MKHLAVGLVLRQALLHPMLGQTSGDEALTVEPSDHNNFEAISRTAAESFEIADLDNNR